MKKRFIVLIDFSEYSNNLLKYAYDWSKQVGAELLLVHQTTVLAPALTDADTRKDMALYANNEAEQKLNALAETTLPKDTGYTVFVSENDILLTLESLIAEHYEDLIFLGLKGSGVLKKLFIGSTALQIIDNINNLVVAMPKEISSFTQKKIFVGVTEEHPVNNVELNNILGFFDEKSVEVTFFYLADVGERTESIETKLQGVAEFFSCKYKTGYAIYRGEVSFAGIKNIVGNSTDEILVVQIGSRFLSDQFFRKLLINDLVHEGQTPLIVLP